MIKKNLKVLIVTSLVILLPVLAGVILWNQLPEQMPTHWDINGEVDSWSSKGFAVFFFPSLLLAIHWICVFASCADPKSKDHPPKMMALVLWICPMISLLVSSLIYSKVLGFDLSVNIIMPLLVGLMFLVIGNLLPKMRQSYTMGIKLPWTLANEENWNKTHRFGGKVWVIGGIITMATAFVGSFWLLMAVLLAMVLIPTIYSYLLFRKQQKRQEENNEN